MSQSEIEQENKEVTEILKLYIHFYWHLCLEHAPTIGASEFKKNLRKLRKIVVGANCCTLRFFVTSLLFSITREGSRIQLIPRKVPKIAPLPHFTLFP